MRTLLSVVTSEHARLRDSLRGLLLLAARAQEGDVHAWHDLTQRDIKRELQLHAQRERVEVERVFGTRALDDLHQVETRAAILLRVAPDLEDALIHVGEIVEALAEEERLLLAAEERQRAATP